MKYIGLLLLFLISSSSHSRETLQAVLKRMHTQTAVKLAYQEQKNLELIDQPWQGEGFLYSMPIADIMIKQQLKPDAILMAVVDRQLYYYDQSRQIRHQGTLDDDNPFSLNIAVFKALMSQDMVLLEQFYQLDFTSLNNRWQLTLKDKQSPESDFSILISGPLQQPADTIVIHQTDGDQSTMRLKKVAEGEAVKQQIKLLIRPLNISTPIGKH
jgi:hypothetical protein